MAKHLVLSDKHLSLSLIKRTLIPTAQNPVLTVSTYGRCAESGRCAAAARCSGTSLEVGAGKVEGAARVTMAVGARA